MKNYRIYRAIKTETIESVNFNNIGISWAVDELSAEKFASQFGESYLILTSIVREDQINISQTNAQWENMETSNEGEVVLVEFENITIEFEGKEFEGNTGSKNSNDDTRPNPVNCNPEYVTEYLELV